MLVTRTTAEIAIDALANFSVRWIGMACQQIMRAHDHAGSAKAALQAVFLPESLLKWMQLAIAGQAFNRGYTAAICLDCEHSAGFNGASIEQHSAGAT
jgi:hypothetical protein